MHLTKGRIFDTGDVHGSLDYDRIERFSKLPLNFTYDDVLIINGDAGFIWYKDDSHTHSVLMNQRLNVLPFTIFVVLGNHENYDKINKLPIVEKFNGKVRQNPPTPNVYYAERGTVYTINEKKIWCFGGADSIDKFRRTKHLSWWQEELPTQEEMDVGFRNLVENKNKVDYIITHDCPEIFLEKIPKSILIGDGIIKPHNINFYFNDILQNVYYKQWFCGHYHFDGALEVGNDKINFLYKDIIEIGVD